MNTQVFVYTANRIGRVGAWSRYVFPFPIDTTTQLENVVYLRGDDDVWCLVEDDLTSDDVIDEAGIVTTTPFDAVIQWPWLDLGSPGRLKMLTGIDLTGKGGCTIEIGYDQNDPNAFTSPVALPPDTVPGQVIGMALNAPSFSVRITYPGNQKWEFLGAMLYLQDQRSMA